MPARVKARLVLPVVATAAVLAVAGCGDSADGNGGSTDPASVAPPKAPLYIEAAVQPEGELKANVESLAKSIAGVDDLGGLIVSELEKSANDSGEPFDYEKEVAPWLGDKAGIFFENYDGDDFSGYGVAVQTTDVDATQEFIDKVERDDEMTIGVVDGLLVFAEDERAFKDAVDASSGDSLADAEDFASTFDAASSGSFADVFIDIGGLIDQSGGTIDPEALQFLDSAGIDTAEATAVASLIPGSDQVEIEVSSDLSGDNPPSGDASSLLGSLPADSVAAIAVSDFGARFGEALDQIDADGIPGEIPPGKFKSTLKEAGIDVDKIAAAIGDLGVFAEGSSERSLVGAAVLSTKGSKEATNTVSNIGLLLRASGTPGVTAISGKLSGFSVRGTDLGPKPLVIAAESERIAIAYGLPAATRALATDSSQTLADSPTYKEAVNALGSTPISGFADGPAALKLAAALIPTDEQEGFLEAKPYLTTIDYLAIGVGASGDLGTAKLIAGVSK